MKTEHRTQHIERSMIVPRVSQCHSVAVYTVDGATGVAAAVGCGAVVLWSVLYAVWSGGVL